MNEPLFLTPVFQERIWGGTKLNTIFGYDIPNDKTGECWAVSGHPNGQSIVHNGKYAGQKLNDLWVDHAELFGDSESDVFPLLTKILDASDDLSVQVHPDDAYAREFENGELGKTECWYIIDAEPGATLIYGHHAQSREELRSMIDHGQWDELLTKIEVKPGDFFYVPSGTIHALGAGILVLETQQSSDTTYRVYDYDRKDANGNGRELHLEKAIDVTTIPQSYTGGAYETDRLDGVTITKFVSNSFFTVEKWDVDGVANFADRDRYTIVSILSGEGKLNNADQQYPLKKGDHFIIPAKFGDYTIEGTLTTISSWE
ncbi:mannose-6-phosphate isomerase, class I [Saccharibacillus sp. JS10]|uniref:mannose-6-phosphate isomerase, class I n=1 Tax=Saccharibacillus sp. JS10 TaxID=2950552 RepID=UPI002109C06A|nr:mannose-6-phosphate isomerase, class I [Saccharibacillus sp. JS10]MCQ4088633.1 mannose-6-phosphate isomerase, class I [Saccharibacillus sp. JS10]